MICLNLEKYSSFTYFIFTGFSGSGKSEISINFSLALTEKYKTSLFDLDVVKPYIRIRDVAFKINNPDLEVIEPESRLLKADIPIFPRHISARLIAPDSKKVIDLGGDKNGAGVISQFRETIGEDYYLFFVLNSRRPFTRTPDEVKNAIGIIENSSKLKIKGIVANSNLMDETDTEIIKEGYWIAKEVSEDLNINFSFVSINKKLLNGDQKLFNEVDNFIDSPVFPIEIFIRYIEQ